ncbi:MAG: tetratricopeptide repeat protein [Rhodospirillales bacterium]|nr:tetratricopeptide repeat protein [Rhodospirillales bacterium]
MSVPPAPARDPLDHAHAAWRDGRLDEAAAAAQAILESHPDDGPALLLLGRIALAARKPNVAAPLLERALAQGVEAGLAHLELGRALRAMDRRPAARQHLERAVALLPEEAEGHYQLAEVLAEAGEGDQALAHLDRAAALEPDLADLLAARARILAGMGRKEEALAEYRHALALAPRAAIHTALAGLLVQSGRLDEAIEHYRAAVTLDPGSAQAWNNLSDPLKRRSRLAECVSALREAVALDPGNALIRNNLALALRLAEGAREALEQAQRAIALKPDFADAYVNLGYIFNLVGEHRAAEAAMRKAVAINPRSPVYQGALGHVLNARGANAPAIEAFQASLAADPSSALVRSNLLMTLCYSDKADPDEVAQEHFRFGVLHEAPFRDRTPVFANARDPDRRLRIGYVSPDFRVHSVAYFFEPILAAHDRTGFEVTLYANQLSGDATTQRLRGMAERWRDIRGLDDDEAARLVREDGIDILVDLAGHSADNRLDVFARKPAPVQATWIGYPNTTGLRAVDWRLTDAIADPPGQTEAWHTERLWRLPRGFLCYQAPEDSPAITPLAPRPSGQAVFGCCNNQAKVSDATVALWAAVLRALPESLLAVKNRSMDDAWARADLVARFEQEGIDPQRLKLIGRIPARDGHLATYNLFDIALDTYPYNGTTTTCEALWMGTPVVTRAGRTHASRVGAALLEPLGLGELVADSDARFVAIAQALAREPERLALLRLTLRDRLKTAPLLQASVIAGDVEAAYRGMWREWLKSQPPT